MSEPYWVPLSSTPLFYAGAYSAAATYKPGDVVLYNGVYYLAAADSTGQTPPPALPASVAIGTSLPASPFDGQEFILVDSLTAPTYQWRFRYVAGITDANKWVFVGGAPASAEVAPLEATNSTAYVALTTPGPSVTVPRAGIYEVTIECSAFSSANFSGYMSYDVGATTALDDDSACPYGPTGVGYATATMTRRKTVAAGAAIVSKYKATGGTQSFRFRRLFVTPVRVA